MSQLSIRKVVAFRYKGVDYPSYEGAYSAWKTEVKDFFFPLYVPKEVIDKMIHDRMELAQLLSVSSDVD